MDTFQYWLTRRGVRKGNIPNRKAFLYLAYKKWVLNEFGEDVPPLSFRKWSALMKKWGPEEMLYKGRGRTFACYMMNKWLVPKRSMLGTDWDDWTITTAL